MFILKFLKTLVLVSFSVVFLPGFFPSGAPKEGSLCSSKAGKKKKKKEQQEKLEGNREGYSLYSLSIACVVF